MCAVCGTRYLVLHVRCTKVLAEVRGIPPPYDDERRDERERERVLEDSTGQRERESFADFAAPFLPITPTQRERDAKGREKSR